MSKLWRLLKIIVCAKVAAIAVVLMFGASTLHDDWLFSKAQNTVVKVMGEQGHGTGFFVKGKSGKAYIVTNAHVCGLADAAGILAYKGEGDRVRLGKVLGKPIGVDLCVISNVFGQPFEHEALDIASYVSKGDMVSVFGHPTDNPFSSSKGCVSGDKIITLMVGMLPPKLPEVGPSQPAPEVGKIVTILDTAFDMVRYKSSETNFVKCNLPRQRIENINYFGMELQICVQEFDSIMATVLIQPGNSGSPVLNYWGNVVAVIFAGSSRDLSWAYAVPLVELAKVLDSI